MIFGCTRERDWPVRPEDVAVELYLVRVLPFHPDEGREFLPGLITWSGAETKVEELVGASR